MPSGNSEGSLKDLVFERATNLAALNSFKCGVDIVDAIIHTDPNLNRFMYRVIPRRKE